MIWTVSARMRRERGPRSVSSGWRRSAAGRASSRVPRRRRVGGPSSSTSSRWSLWTCGAGASLGSSATTGSPGARRPSASGRARRRKRWARGSEAVSSSVSAAMRFSASSGRSIPSPRSARSPWRRTAAAATTAVRSPLPPLASRPSIQAAATIWSSTSEGMVGNHSPATLRRRMRARRSARVSVSPSTPPLIPRNARSRRWTLARQSPAGDGKGTHRSPDCHLPNAQVVHPSAKPPVRLGFDTASRGN